MPPKIIYGPFYGGSWRCAYVRCPGCREAGWIGPDQYQGLVSIDCDRCDYHQTHDLRKQSEYDR